MRIRLTLDINWKKRPELEEGSYVILSSEEDSEAPSIGFGADVDDMRRKQ